MGFFVELKRRNVVRVAVAYGIVGWLVVEIASVLFPTFEAPPWVMKVFATVVILGFVVAVVLSWAYEITADGIKLTKAVDKAHSITATTGRKLDFVIIGLMALALAYFVSTHDWEGKDETEDEITVVSTQKSIAVLPFVNMSDDAENEYFSDGISEELLNVLIKVEGLKVASRTSSFAYKDKDVSIPEIADDLKVDHVLEGSVRKAGNKVRITAQLIDVKSDRHLWSETYDRELEDIFAIQDEISHQIVEALKVALGAGESEAIAHAAQPTSKPEAYELFLQGRYFWQRRGEDNIRRAIDLFTQATELDPDFARAWSSLAAAYITLPVYSTVPENDAWPNAGSAAQQALELDDGLAEAYAVLGDLARGETEWVEAENYYQKAIASEPKDATSHLWYGEHLSEVGRVEDALQEFLIAYELDPLHPGTNSNLGSLYLFLGDVDNAAKHGQTALDLHQTFGLSVLGDIALRQGRYDEAIVFFEQLEDTLGVEPGSGISRPFVDALRDPAMKDKALRMLGANEATLPIFVLLPDYVFLGEVDVAYDAAYEHWVDAGGGNQWIWMWDEPMAPFRRHPRFKDLTEELGLVEYWRANEWPDVCQPVGDSFECH